jgi:hypothetical protein
MNRVRQSTASQLEPPAQPASTSETEAPMPDPLAREIAAANLDHAAEQYATVAR